MRCHGCGERLNPAGHADLVCDGEVWCGACRTYDPELVRPRPVEELAEWGERLCRAFDREPVPLDHDPEAVHDWRRYWVGDVCQLGEADHRRGRILLHPPGYRLTSLCHELAHIFSGQDHTEEWARTFAVLVAWVRSRL